MSQDVYDLVILPGDGIGLEVMDQALKCLDAVSANFGVELRRQTFACGVNDSNRGVIERLHGAFSESANVGG